MDSENRRLNIESEGELSLFERYVAGDCTAEEAGRVEQMIATNPERSKILRDLAKMKAATKALDDGWHVDALWDGVRSRLDEPVRAEAGAVTETPPPFPHARHSTEARETVEQTAARSSTRASTRTSTWAWSIGRAAALVVIAVGATVVWQRLTGRSSAPLATSGMRAYTTQAGQQAMVQLLDGSKIALAPTSTMLVPADFGRIARDVELDGQAYFEVAPDASKPFRVRSGGAVTWVLGTKFGVRAYPGEGRVVIAVVEGRVRVERDTATRRDEAGAPVLRSGDVAHVAPTGTVRVEHGADLSRYLSWRAATSGDDVWLTFVDAPLPEILAELERWHGVRFALGDRSLASRILTTRLKPGGLQATLAVLEAALDVRAIQSDSGVRLERRGTTK